MADPINWKDDYYRSKERIVLTNQELQIPGIRLFGTHKIQNAIMPLLPHYHEDAFEFTLVVKGSMSFYTAQSEYDVPGGSVFVSFPNETHSTNNVPISLNHQYWLQIDISDCRNLLFLNEKTAERLISDLKKIERHIIATDNREIRVIIENAFSLAVNNGNRVLIAGYLIVFFQLLISSSQKGRYHSTPDIEHVIAFIKAHITEELSLDTLAQECNLSTSQLKQKFRHVVGVSPRNYINRLKIDYAKELLLTGISVTDAGLNLGFNTSSYFSSVFKKYTMESPREYISRHTIT